MSFLDYVRASKNNGSYFTIFGGIEPSTGCFESDLGVYFFSDPFTLGRPAHQILHASTSSSSPFASWASLSSTLIGARNSVARIVCSASVKLRPGTRYPLLSWWVSIKMRAYRFVRDSFPTYRPKKLCGVRRSSKPTKVKTPPVTVKMVVKCPETWSGILIIWAY